FRWSAHFIRAYIDELATDAMGAVYASGHLPGGSSTSTIPIQLGTHTAKSCDGDVFHLTKIDASGTTISSRNFNGGNQVNGLAVNAGGDIIILGSSSGDLTFGTLTLANVSGMYLAKVNAAGTLVSNQTIVSNPSTSPDFANSLSIDGMGATF